MAPIVLPSRPRDTKQGAKDARFGAKTFLCRFWCFQGALSLPGCDGTFGNFRSQWVLLFSSLSLCFSLFLVISSFLVEFGARGGEPAQEQASKQASQPASKQAVLQTPLLRKMLKHPHRTSDPPSPKRGLIVRQKEKKKAKLKTYKCQNEQNHHT